MLEAQLRMLQRDGEPERARSSEASSTPTHDESLPTPKPETPASPVQLRSILDTITPVAENDARLEPTIDIPLAQQRRLLAVRDNLRRIEHFELLGLDPIDDPKAIRRAYHIVSRGFHPDTWYGKNIGNFRPVLDDLFRRTRASFELLGDPTRRQALVEAHRSKTHGQQALRSSAEQARALEQREAEKRQAERVEAEARATQAAKEAREARDRERRLRQRDRGSLVREQQGRHYATEAKAAFEAGRFGNAASLYRLAMGMVPDEPKYEQHWRDALEKARHERAESAHGRALEHKAAGRIAEAARCFAEAADAEASLRNATDAAAALGDREPQRARAFALLALEALANAQHRGESPDERTQVRTHLVCARAFLAAGQVHSARQQAERAHAIAPSEQTSALLNTINLA
jgi:Arc/MetJ-type ribon-helix-helix transcriptional regulator